MSRIFTTSFSFRKATYSALVSVQTKNNDLCIQVKFQDEDLLNLVPDGKLSIGPCDESALLMQARSSLLKELVTSVTEAVEKYLASHKVMGAA